MALLYSGIMSLLASYECRPKKNLLHQQIWYCAEKGIQCFNTHSTQFKSYLSRQCWATSALTSKVSHCKLFLTSLLSHCYYNKLFNTNCLIYSKTYTVYDPK